MSNTDDAAYLASSLGLLESALRDIDSLSKQACRGNRVLQEGLDATPLERILLECEYILEQEEKGNDEEGFLKKTAGALTKLTAAADTAVKEIDDYLKKLPPTFNNVRSALEAAKEDIIKKKPGESFLSKIGSGAGMAIRSLFGKQDDPVEKVTELVTDVNLFKTIISKATSELKKSLADIDIPPERADEFNNMTFAELVTNEELLELGFPDEKKFQKAVAATFKEPKGMFGGFKSLGSSLGMTLGGDLPLGDKIDKEQFFQDLMATKLSDLGTTADQLKGSVGKADQSTQDLGASLQTIQQQREANPEVVQDLAGGEEGEDTAPEEDASTGKDFPNIDKLAMLGKKVFGNNGDVVVRNYFNNPEVKKLFGETAYYKGRVANWLFEQAEEDGVEFEEFFNKLQDHSKEQGLKIDVDLAKNFVGDANQILSKKIKMPDLHTGRPEGEEEGDETPGTKKGIEGLISSLEDEISQLKAEFEKMAKNNLATKEDIQNMIDALAADMNISPEALLSALQGEIDKAVEELQTDAEEGGAEGDAVEEEVEDDVDKIENLAGELEGAVDAGLDSEDAVDAIEDDVDPKTLYEPGEVKKLDPAPRKHGKNNVSFASKPKGGGKVRYFATEKGADDYAKREAILYLQSQGMLLYEISFLSDPEIFEMYFKLGGTETQLLNSAKRRKENEVLIFEQWQRMAGVLK